MHKSNICKAIYAWLNRNYQQKHGKAVPSMNSLNNTTVFLKLTLMEINCHSSLSSWRHYIYCFGPQNNPNGSAQESRSLIFFKYTLKENK